MATQLITQQPSNLEACAGDRGALLEPTRPMLLDPGERHEAMEPCDIRIGRATHSAHAWCDTHHVLVGAVLDLKPVVDRAVAAWRGRRRCEA